MKPDIRAIDRPDVSQERAERFDNAKHQIAQLLEDENDRLTFYNFAERYLKAKLRVLVNLRSLGSRQSKKFCAIYQHPSMANDDVPSFVTGKALKGVAQRVNDQIVMGGNGYQKSVFVYDVESVQMPERIVPSLVWLKTLDEVQNIFAGTTYFSLQAGFKTFAVKKNGKRSGIIRRSAVGSHHLVGQMVKTGAQIVNRIPNDGDNEGRGMCNQFKLYDSITGLRVVISDRAISAGFPKFSLFDPKVVDVLVGPFEFGPS